MINSSPLVSVLMPVYNGEKYLREAIDSILNQTFTDFEFLIINDGSTDDTENIILSYTDARIRYLKNKENLKLIATLNKGLDLAQGKYIARMDADDISLPKRLEQQVDFMEKNPNIGLLGSWVRNFGEGNDYDITFNIGHRNIRFELFFHNYFHHPSVMLRTEILRKYNLYFPRVLHAEDYALWINLSNYTEFEILPAILLYYRSHGDNISELYKDFQKKQTSDCRKMQLTSLGMEINQLIFDTYEDFIDSGKIKNTDQFSNLIYFIESITKTNNEKKVVDPELLFNYYRNRINEFVEQNCWQMGKELDTYFNSIFCFSQKQKIKIKFKQKLGLKKIWN
jgi:glycosyltransferase involved in cell wall biosynthesis